MIYALGLVSKLGKDCGSLGVPAEFDLGEWQDGDGSEMNED